MPAETTAADILQRQVDTLTSQLEKIQTERDGYRDSAKAITDERDELKARVTKPSEQAARIAELEAAIRDRNHFDKFAELAKASRAKDKALKQLWRDCKDRGYQPDSDVIDDKALHAALETLQAEVDYAFDPEPTPVTTPVQEAARVTSRTKYGLEMREDQPAGGGRASRNQGSDGTIVTQEMRADPKFMLDPKNRELIRDAAIGGRFR